jgi:glycosyltransferase involved in cell wall biosynthesis
MYPALLFPGVKQAMDPDKPPMNGPMLRVEHRLTWYNPLGWLCAGLFTPADLFHLQWWSLPLFPVSLTLLVCMKLRRKPIVVTVHNVLPHEGGRALVWAGRTLCRWANAVIVHGTENRTLLIEQYGIASERVHALEMPVQPGPTPLPSRDEARRTLGLAADAQVVLCFGIIRPYKGIDVLLRAFARISSEFPQARLLIVGRPWCDWRPYQEIIDSEKLGERIHCLLDYVPDARVAACFAAADLAVLPYTHFDAQSAVGAQFIAHGIPLLVSDVGGLPDWVDGDPEWIVRAGDVDAWIAALTQFLVAPSARTHGFTDTLHRVRARCAPDCVADSHVAIYSELISQETRR